MKRSEINQAIRNAEDLFARYNFKLPKFASWSEEDWQKQNPDDIAEIFDCNLGWDITDFGTGDFQRAGLLLFTIRNGVNGSDIYTKRYAEKIMISRSNQLTLMHCHMLKTEDIINRAGGRLVFELYNRKGDSVEFDDTPVKLVLDGRRITVPAGGKVVLDPGESLTLTPNVFHQFWAEEGDDVMIGEVSSVNDDHTDNLFYNPQQRFPGVEEDEPLYRRTVMDYRDLQK